MEQRQREPIASPQIIAIEPAVKPSRRGRASKKLEESLTAATVAPLGVPVEPAPKKRRTSTTAPRTQRTTPQEKVWAVPDSNPVSPPAEHPDSSLERVQQLRQQVALLQAQAEAIAQQSQVLSTEMQALQQTARSLPRTIELPPLPSRSSSSTPSARFGDWAGNSVEEATPISQSAPYQSVSQAISQPAAKPSVIHRGSPAAQPTLAPATVSQAAPAVPVMQPKLSSEPDTLTRPVSLLQQQQAIATAQSLRHQAIPPHTSHAPTSNLPPTSYLPPRSTTQSSPQAPHPKIRPSKLQKSHIPSVQRSRQRDLRSRSLRKLWTQVRPLLNIPKKPGAIVVDAGLWTLAAMGIRIGLQMAIAWVPALALPLNLLMLIPAASAVYLAFYVPQSSTAIVYRLLLLTLGLFLGGRVG
ncbi:MAG: hypothetical protein VKJ24_13010 [Synechococcales bacterium]|nr:hypothetical protein [Synechococcales bacterium]